MWKTPLLRGLAALASASLLLAATACSTSQTAAGEGKEGKKVTLLSYEAFNLSPERIADFQKVTGYKLEITKLGDGAELANKLVLTKDKPLGDVVFGIDNNTAGRTVTEDVFAKLDDPVEDSEIGKYLVPLDRSDVCVNVDKEWFKKQSIQPPASYEDLTSPTYKDLTVVEDPRSSTPGLAFLLGTIKHFGDDGWQKYWKDLKSNGVKVDGGWSDAFNNDYTAGPNESGSAGRPIMVSYGSSPAWEVDSDKDLAGQTTRSEVLKDTCYRQIEYAGVLKNSKDLVGAKALLGYLRNPAVEHDLVENNYVYPIKHEDGLPPALEKFGYLAPEPNMLDAIKVSQQSESWLRLWSEAVGE